MNEKTDIIASNNDNVDKTEGAIVTNTAIATNNTILVSNDKTKPLENTALTSNSTNTVSANEITTNTVSTEVTTNAVVSNNTETSASANTLLNEAETLSNKATLQRKEAATKTGIEKETLLKQASDNQKTATSKKIQASEINQKQNKETFDNTNLEVTELKKLTGTKTNTEISQATKLLDDATVSFNQAQKIREEANANTNNAAKLGGLSNAEEKENEALLKQQKGLEILTKENPNYKSKTTDIAVAKKDSSAAIISVIAKGQQLKIDELLNQSKANQSELETKGNQLTNNSEFNNPANKPSQDLKLKSDVLKNDATDIVTLQSTMNSLPEKLTLLEEVNKKEKEALKLLNESNETLTKNNNVANANTVVPTNTIAAVTENTVTTTEIVADTNTTTVIATNTQTIASNETPVTPTNTVISTNTESKFQEPITSLINEAEKLNNDASVLRKSANSKTGAEKDNDLNAAKSLEKQAITKKVEAAYKQQQLNTATYSANKQSLEDLAVMAKGKNISELNSVDEQLKEADVLLKQANSLRTETANYPSDAAKLGGYSNAEEKEGLALLKQKAALDIYKKYFSNYTAKEPNLTAVNNANASNTISDSKNQQSIDSLNLLISGSNDLYKSRFLSLATSLNPAQTTLKTKAQTAYKKNQGLLLKANQTTDLSAKKNILIDANNTVTNANNLLQQINETTAIASNTTTNKTTVNNTPVKEVKIKTEELVVANSNAYTNAKPIPIDEKMPDGLIYKVQIGAFRTALPNNTFKGLSPVVGQTTPNGFIRYMAGHFDNIKNANAVKNDLNKLGFTDAFVVAYYNGVRVNLNEVLKNAKLAGEDVVEATNSETSAGLTKNISIARNNQTTNNSVNTTINTEAVAVTSELEKMNGLLYTVQIGVYSKQTTSSQLSNLKPIYTEQLPNGLYRYTAGIYNQSDLIVRDKRKVVDLGVKDAFITAYYNSKRIPFTDGKKLQFENSNLKMETQNPIIFNESTNATSINNVPINTPAVANTPTLNVTAFSNGVTTTPIPTAENGVKTDDSGISFKVQVGAYRYQVPNDVAAKFSSIKNWPVNNVVINGLYIYTFGNFNAASFAKKLRDEAVALGITDAFVTVYKDGKKLYGAEALQYLNR